MFSEKENQGINNYICLLFPSMSLKYHKPHSRNHEPTLLIIPFHIGSRTLLSDNLSQNSCIQVEFHNVAAGCVT